MKKYWAKFKEFFSRPKVIKWLVIILSVVIVIGAIKALIWTIYTKDKPVFVPEEIREDIQGAIKESGEVIKKVSEPIGSAIVDAGFVDESDYTCCRIPDEDDLVEDETANWPTYTSEELGISVKYPEGWSTFQGEDSIFSFGPDEDSLDHITFYVSKVSNDTESYWSSYTEDDIGLFVGPENVKIGQHTFMIYKQQDGMKEVHYLTEMGDVVYDIMPGGEGFDYVEKVLATIN